MILSNRIHTLLAQVEKFRQRNSRRDESKKLQSLRTEVKPLKENLDEEVQQIRLLLDREVSLDLQKKHAILARKQLDKLLQHFSENFKAENLTCGDDWPRFEQHVDATISDIRPICKSAWSQFVDTSYSGESPRDLKKTLPHTECNLAQLKIYQSTYQELQRLRKTRPTQRADFDKIGDLARQLREIGQQFERDVPKEVDHFLRAVNAGNATLNLVTAEVMDWLQQQNKTDDFRVVVRSSSS
ncbi:hypothetical protein ACQZV8_02525 [Magnetococcales bacterium HHB-1]